jgi:hypothetical protein
MQDEWQNISKSYGRTILQITFSVTVIHEYLENLFVNLPSNFDMFFL